MENNQRLIGDFMVSISENDLILLILIQNSINSILFILLVYLIGFLDKKNQKQMTKTASIIVVFYFIIFSVVDYYGYF